MKISFFDFDGTLTRHDTFIEFAKFARGNLLFIKALIKTLPVLLLWKMGLRSNSYAKQTLFSNLYKGMDYKLFCQWGEKFKDRIDRDLKSEVVEILDAQINQGHKVVIVSASMKEWIAPWARERDVQVISTEVEVDSAGRLTGRFSIPNCHGAEKAVRIGKAFSDIEECETWAYGDSSGDDAMLAMVDHPVRVRK